VALLAVAGGFPASDRLVAVVGICFVSYKSVSGSSTVLQIPFYFSDYIALSSKSSENLRSTSGPTSSALKSNCEVRQESKKRKTLMCLSTFLGVAFDPVKPEAPLYFVEAMELNPPLTTTSLKSSSTFDTYCGGPCCQPAFLKFLPLSSYGSCSTMVTSSPYTSCKAEGWAPVLFGCTVPGELHCQVSGITAHSQSAILYQTLVTQFWHADDNVRGSQVKKSKTKQKQEHQTVAKNGSDRDDSEQGMKHPSIFYLFEADIDALALDLQPCFSKVHRESACSSSSDDWEAEAPTLVMFLNVITSQPNSPCDALNSPETCRPKHIQLLLLGAFHCPGSGVVKKAAQDKCLLVAASSIDASLKTMQAQRISVMWRLTAPEIVSKVKTTPEETLMKLAADCRVVTTSFLDTERFYPGSSSLNSSVLRAWKVGTHTPENKCKIGSLKPSAQVGVDPGQLHGDTSFSFSRLLTNPPALLCPFSIILHSHMLCTFCLNGLHVLREHRDVQHHCSATCLGSENCVVLCSISAHSAACGGRAGNGILCAPKEQQQNNAQILGFEKGKDKAKAAGKLINLGYDMFVILSTAQLHRLVSSNSSDYKLPNPVSSFSFNNLEYITETRSQAAQVDFKFAIWRRQNPFFLMPSFEQSSKVDISILCHSALKNKIEDATNIQEVGLPNTSNLILKWECLSDTGFAMVSSIANLNISLCSKNKIEDELEINSSEKRVNVYLYFTSDPLPTLLVPLTCSLEGDVPEAHYWYRTGTYYRPGPYCLVCPPGCIEPAWSLCDNDFRTYVKEITRISLLYESRKQHCKSVFVNVNDYYMCQLPSDPLRTSEGLKRKAESGKAKSLEDAVTTAGLSPARGAENQISGDTRGDRVLTWGNERLCSPPATCLLDRSQATRCCCTRHSETEISYFLAVVPAQLPDMTAFWY
ncbi:hypothetical protein U0070_004138, partial [Myodes glareolus]